VVSLRGSNPDRWTIVWDVEFEGHTFDGTLTELLIAELTGALEPQLTDFTADQPVRGFMFSPPTPSGEVEALGEA